MKKMFPKQQTINVSSILESSKNTCSIGNEVICFNDLSDLPFSFEEKVMDSVLIGVCLEGEMRLTIDAVEYIIKPNDIFVVSVGHKAGDFYLDRTCRGMALLGSKTFFHEVVKDMIDVSRLFMYINRYPVRSASSEECEMMKSALRLLRERSSVLRPKYAMPFAVSVIKALTFDVFNASVDYGMNAMQVNTKGEKVFFEFINLVEANFRTERRVGWYAEQIGISSKYLSELVKAVSSETPNAWIDKYVVMELRVLLHDPMLNIKEITEMMNFPNQSFLGKYFKEHVGMSPSNYRKKL